MKNKHLLYLLTALTFFAGLVALNSCSHNDLDELSASAGAPQGETVTLQIAGAETRTALEEGGRVVWSEGDIVFINESFYTVYPDPEDPTRASIPNVAASDSYLAYYASNYALTSDNQVACQWATTQPYVADGFAPDVCPMVAYSTGEPLYFHQVGALLKFGLTGDSNLEVDHIQLETDYVSWYFMSDPAVVANGEVSYIPLDASFMRLFDLTFDNPVALDPETPRWFYFCLPPTTYTQGFKFSIRTSDSETIVKQTAPGNTYTLESGKIYTLPALSYGLSDDATALQASIDNASGPYVTYTLTGEPNSTAIATIIRKQEFEQTTPETLLDALKMGLSVQFDAEGRRRMQAIDPIPASTDCVLVYAYLNGAEIEGEPVTLPFRTNDAQQPAPSLTITEVPVVSPTSQYTINLRTETPIAALRLMTMTQSYYDQLMTEYASPLDLFFSPSFFSGALPEENLSQVMTPDGYDLMVGNALTPETDYIVLLLAYGADGAIDLLEYPFTTEAYLDPEASWVTVSTSATMECGIFSPLALSQITIDGLTVEKLEDRDLFRIVDPFALDRVPELANSEYPLTEASDEPYYMLIDATNPDDVIVDVGVNQLNLLIWGNTPMSIATYNHMVGYEAMAHATYDAARGTIQFPEGSLVIMINGLYQCAATTIHLNR